MSTVRPILILLGALLAAPLFADDGKQLSIEVFTQRDRPLHGLQAFEREGIEVKVTFVDDILRVNRELSVDLPGNESQARQVATHRIQRRHGALSQRVQQAVQGLIRAMTLQIDQLPAIVFNDTQAIVLGVTDLGNALQRYRVWQAARRNRR
ncbi:MAG: TIGR03757 family integrating conjugative element protein [bacterium]|nr:TIGR03757 family integrating conjugative element protein [bacterium]